MCDSWETSSCADGGGSGGSGGGGVMGRKWVCKACTYENWPRALKCAICCQPQNYNIFLDPHRPHDIYEIASLFESAQNQNNVYNPKNKWSCASCTYLNWPKAGKCTQCQRRRSSSPPFSRQDGLGRADHIRSPKLKSKDHHHSERRSENHTFPLIPSWTPNPDLRSRTGDEGSDYYYNDRNRISGGGGGGGNMERRTSISSTRSPPPSASATVTTPAPSSNVQKWPCSVCTYENWPRATRCNMCQARRRRSSFGRTSETDAITDNLSLMRLAKSADVPDPHDGNGSSRAEASGGILIDSLSGFPSDSEAEEEDDGSGGLIAFKQRRKRE